MKTFAVDADGWEVPQSTVPSDVIVLPRADVERMVTTLVDAAAILRYLAPGATGADFGTKVRALATDLKALLSSDGRDGA